LYSRQKGDSESDDGSGDEEEAGGASMPSEGDKSEPSPTVADYVIHFLTLFWKLMFAFIPPTGKAIESP
jgi:hypothetical protein